jgi:hypothetical protein
LGALGLVLRFLVHIFFGTFLFVGVGVPAVGLDFLMHLLAEHDLPHFMVVVGRALEYLVFCVDAILYGLFVSVEGWRLGREIWERRNGG